MKILNYCFELCLYMFMNSQAHVCLERSQLLMHKHCLCDLSCSQELSDFKHISGHTFWCFRQYLFLCFSFSLLYSINIIIYIYIYIYIYMYILYMHVCVCLRWMCIDWFYHFHKMKCCLVCLRTTYWCTTGLFSQRGHRELPVDSYCHLANSSSRKP